jgi:hypothetical protein
MNFFYNLNKKKIEKKIIKYGLDKNISYLMDYIYHNQFELAKYYISLIEDNFNIENNSFDEYYMAKSKALILASKDGKKNLQKSLEMLEILKKHPAIQNDEMRQNDIDKIIDNIKNKMK